MQVLFVSAGGCLASADTRGHDARWHSRGVHAAASHFSLTVEVWGQDQPLARHQPLAGVGCHALDEEPAEWSDGRCSMRNQSMMYQLA